MFNRRPPTPKYCAIWDVNVVLQFLSAMRTDTALLKSQKLATLLMLLSGNRVNMLSHMEVTHMYLSDNECTFVFDSPLKHSRPGYKGDIMSFRAYPTQPSLCPVKCITEYMCMRGERCGASALFITTTKPYRGAHPDTISRWIKTILCDAGIDTRTYQTHSCRAASTSAEALQGVLIGTIVKSACWSNVDTFKKFYLKDIECCYTLSEENIGR